MIFGNTQKLLTLAIIVTAISFSGCYKLKDMFIMKGEWTVQSVEIDGGSTNHMNTILPGFDKGNDCCKYEIYFGDDDKLIGRYFVDDTLNYAIAGEWRLVEHNRLYLDADKFIKGTFEVEEQSAEDILLYADTNFVKFYGIGYVELLIRAHRD